MANNYQLLIKHILKTPIAQASRKEIVYRGELRFTYPAFVARVHRLAGALTALGAKPGMRIAVADWDSHRYLEAYFAVPMLGCVLMMVNIRLSPAQIAYTLDHSDAEILLINKDFFPACRNIRDQLPKIRQVVCLSDDHAPEDGGYGEKYAGRLRNAARRRSARLRLSRISMKTPSPPPSTPPAPPASPRACVSRTGSWCYTP